MLNRPCGKTKMPAHFLSLWLFLFSTVSFLIASNLTLVQTPRTPSSRLYGTDQCLLHIMTLFHTCIYHFSDQRRSERRFIRGLAAVLRIIRVIYTILHLYEDNDVLQLSAQEFPIQSRLSR